MKILQIMPEFGLAGAERMAESLILELKQLGCEVGAVSLYDYHSAITDNLESHGVKIYYLGKKRGPDLSIPEKLIQVFRKERPDIVHTHRYVCEYVIPAAILTKVRGRIHTVHNVAEKERLPKKLQHLFYHFCHVHPVGLSPLVTQSVQQFYKLPAHCVPTIYNGIHMAKTKQKNNYQANETFHFLHVGRFAEQKNHAAIIQAFAAFHQEHPNADLTFVGSGELFAQVQEQIQSLGLENVIKTPGQVDNIIELYSQYDAFLLPSLYEGMPITLIEAMSSAMPIIASEVGGIPDMLRHNYSGLLCSPNPDSIAAAMTQLYADEALRQRLGQQALLDASRFSAQHMAESYLTFYQKILQNPSSQ